MEVPPAPEPEPEPEPQDQTEAETFDDGEALGGVDPQSEGLGPEAEDIAADEGESIESGCSGGSGQPLAPFWSLLALTFVIVRRAKEVA